MVEAKWAIEGKMLGDLIDARGYSRKEFAALLGVSDDVLGNLARGITKLNKERRQKAAAILQVDERALRRAAPLVVQETVRSYGSGIAAAREEAVPVARAGIRHVPVYGSIPAGIPGKTMSDAIDIIEMADWGGAFDRWGRVIYGDSMLEEFQERDIAIFENRRANDYNGVHATRDGEDAFKILVPTKGGHELWPTNPEFEPFSADGWEIWGVCIKRIRMGDGGIVDTRDYPYGYLHRFR